MAINTRKIANNTVYIYLRTLLVIAITLFSSRVLLKNLGIDGYGVYNLVGSVVLLFASMRGILATATQRFLNYTRGSSSIDDVRDIFHISIVIHAAVCLLFLIIVECAGLYLLAYRLNIPPEYRLAANVVLQCSILTVMLNVMTIPFDGVIISNERFKPLAWFAILDEGLKLLGALILVFLRGNAVIWYAVFVLIAAVAVLFARLIFCRASFPECRGRGRFDGATCRRMGRFIGWNSLGFITLTIYHEGTNMFLNVFGGVVANSARAIANQVSQGISRLSGTLISGASPQAVQHYARGEHSEFFKVIILSSKIISLLFICIAAPIMAYTSELLRIWLGEVPEYTVSFIHGVIVYGFFMSFQAPIDICFKAHGDLKRYQILDSAINLSILLAVWLSLRFGAPLPSVFYVMAIFTVIRILVISRMAQSQVGLPLGQYLLRTFLPLCLCGIIAWFFIRFILTPLIPSLWASIPLLLGFLLIAIPLLGLSRSERRMALSLVRQKFLKRNPSQS